MASNLTTQPSKTSATKVQEQAQDSNQPPKVRQVSLRYRASTALTDAVLIVEKQKLYVSKMVSKLNSKLIYK